MDDSGESSQAERWRVVCRGVGGTSAVWEALMKYKGSMVALFLLLFSFAPACGFLIFTLWDVPLAWQSRSWPRVAGVVKSAYQDDSIESAKISYEFRLDGRIYTGDRVRSYTGSGFVVGYAQADLRKYPVGSKVTVYYNPRDPSNCRLEPGLSLTYLLAALAGLVYAALLCVVVLRALGWRKKVDRMTVAIPGRDPSVSASISGGEAFEAASASPLSPSTIAEPPAEVVATSEDGHRVQIRFEGGRAAFAPGEAVAVRMDLDPETASLLTSLDLEWRWQTEGKGTEDVGVFHSEAVPVDGQAGQARFAFMSPPLPPTPWSYEGKLLTIRWGVRLRLGVGGRRRKLEADLPLNVPVKLALLACPPKPGPVLMGIVQLAESQGAIHAKTWDRSGIQRHS